MPVVKPISDLRNKFRSISELVHKHDEAVIITKNGEDDMVVMSYDHYRKIKTRLELYEKLTIAALYSSVYFPICRLFSAPCLFIYGDIYPDTGGARKIITCKKLIANKKNRMRDRLCWLTFG